jgi:putative membrane protein
LLREARESMPELGSRKALLLAVVFAAVVVVLSTAGPGLGALLFTLLPLAALFVVLYFVVRWAVAAGFRDAGASSRTAREVLDERYARDEIGSEDYERMRSRLETS